MPNLSDILFEVFLNDTSMSYEQAEQHFVTAHRWARKNCPSYQDHEVIDVADVSYTNDLIARYRFADDKDVIIFQLKWHA
jgi:hypothetical protein